MALGIFPFVILFLFSGTRSTDLPLDLVSLLDPEIALSMLEKEIDERSLEKLITIRDSGARGGSKVPQGEVEKAIQNLASKSEGVRSRAREKLVEAGPAVRKRLEEVIAEDERRAEEARKVLEVLVGQADAASHEEDIARILAIRLASRKEMKQLIPAIKKASASKNPFVRLAVEDALIRLGEKPKPEEGAGTSDAGTVPGSLERGLTEIEALPATTRVLVALKLGMPTPGSTKGLTLSDLLKKLASSLPVPEDQLGEGVEEGTKEILGFVRQYGNMRPERVYVVNVGRVDNEGGGFGIIVEGLYQPGVLRRAFEGEGGSLWTRSEVAGTTVYTSRDLRLALLSGNSVLLLPEKASLRFPLEEYLKNVASGKKALNESKRYAQFLATLNGDDQVRGLALTDATLMSALHREIENDAGVPAEVAKAVKALKEVELTVTRLEDGKNQIRLEGAFDSPDDSKALTEYFEAETKAQVAEMEKQLQGFPLPFFQALIDIMKGIKFAAEGKRGILRLEAPAMKLEDLFLPFAGMRAVR